MENTDKLDGIFEMLNFMSLPEEKDFFKPVFTLGIINFTSESGLEKVSAICAEKFPLIKIKILELSKMQVLIEFLEKKRKKSSQQIKPVLFLANNRVKQALGEQDALCLFDLVEIID